MSSNQEELYLSLLNDAFRFVSYRPRSEKEISDYLLKRIISRNIKETSFHDKIMDRLRELGYADDEKFAEWWIMQRKTHNAKGERVIRFELSGKGVESSVIEKYLADAIPEKQAAQKALSGKMKLWKDLPVMRRKKKIYDFLARRGFKNETISNIIDENR